jgi:hypothetical protein
MRIHGPAAAGNGEMGTRGAGKQDVEMAGRYGLLRIHVPDVLAEVPGPWVVGPVRIDRFLPMIDRAKVNLPTHLLASLNEARGASTSAAKKVGSFD